MSASAFPYRAPMSEVQLQFFRSLCQPFHPADIKKVPKGNNSYYIEAQTTMNRLDDVAGPFGWKVEYTPTQRGTKCRLWILVPMSDTEWEWQFREDGGGFAGMQEEDNDEKSGYTDGFKRAAMAWGITRVLWESGIPDFLQGVPPQEEPYGGRQAARPSPQRNGESNGQAQRPTQTQSQAPAPSQNGNGNGNGQARGGFDNFKLPPPGKAVFAWAKRTEEHFQTTLVKGMQERAKTLGYGTEFNKWDEHQIADVCTPVIQFLKTLDTYKGEFDHLENKTTVSASPGLRALKGKAVETATRLGKLIHNGDPTPDQIAKIVQNASSQTKDGEVMESLRGCHDEVWIKDTIAYLEDIERKKRADLASRKDDDIPEPPSTEDVDDEIPF